MNNPLKREILNILQNSPGPIKEYDLHAMLSCGSFEVFTAECSDNLRLFRQHFMVMNALYELHQELLQQNYLLHISALDIHIEQLPIKSCDVSKNKSVCDFQLNDGFNKLSNYYLNWDNFNQTDDKEVEQLLSIFWKNYLSYDEKDDALACLELGKDSSWSEIKQRYRHLCQQYHPDKGGNKLYFLQIRQAYDNLKLIYLNR